MSDDDRRRGFVVFQRDYMQDVFYNDTPAERDRADLLRGEAFAGEYEPVTVGLAPLRDLGKVSVSASDLTGPAGTIPSDCDRRRFRLVPYQPCQPGRVRLHDTTSTDHARWSRGRARGPDEAVLADDPDAG